MALSQKMKDATEMAVQVAAGQKEHLKQAASKAESLAKARGGEARERIADARHHAPSGKGKR